MVKFFHTLCLVFPYLLYSQHTIFPPDFFLTHRTFKKIFSPSDSIHPTLFPLNFLHHSAYRYVGDSTRVFRYIEWDQGIDFVFYNPLIRIKPASEPVEIVINPVVHVYNGFDYKDTVRYRYSTNSRGIVGNIKIGEKVLIETFFVENQSFFPLYLSMYASQKNIIPGQGRFKPFKIGGYDYSFSAGIISFQATRNLNIQAGHFKNKIGSGYRSILLSEDAFIYPQIKISSTMWRERVQYTAWAASLMNLDSAYDKGIPGLERLFRKKPLAMQYIHIILHKRMKMGFFQSVTGIANDGQNRFQAGADVFIPIPYLWPLYKKFPVSSHILWGTDVLLLPFENIQVYGQWAFRNDSLGRMNLSRSGWQGGVRYVWDEKKNFSGMVFVEGNGIPHNFYAPASWGKYFSSYTQYGQSLGFQEFIRREITFGGVVMKSRLGWQYIYLVQYPFTTPASCIQHVKNEVFYLLNRSYFLTVFVAYHYRFHDFPNFTRQKTMHFVSFGIRTRLYNLNYEF